MGTNHHVSNLLLSSSAQYRRLNSMHQQLEAELKEISHHVCRDELSEKALKFKKLKVADQMSLLEHLHAS